MISAFFDLDAYQDLYASYLLYHLLSSRSKLKWHSLEKQIWRRPVIIYGAGVTANIDIDEVLDHHLHESCLNMAVDDAVPLLLRRGIPIDFVVTDLDGSTPHLVRASELGATLIVHGHGDNIPSIFDFLSRSDLRILGSSQVVDLPPYVKLIEGFTDGDRALAIACSCGASTVFLVGMDMSLAIGRFSKKGFVNPRLKRMKLALGRFLASETLRRYSETPVYSISRAPCLIDGCKSISPEHARRLLSP